MEQPVKLKILYLITKSNLGGAQRYVYDLATRLPKESFDVRVACGGNGSLTERLQAEGIPTLIIPNLIRNVNVFQDILVFSHILRLLQKERPDIIHLNSSKIGGLGALAGRLVGVKKIIFTAHGWAWHESRSPFSRAVIKTLHWITVLLCHDVITVAEKERVEMAKMPWTKNKLVTIHNGIGAIDFLEKATARDFLITKNPALAVHKNSLWIGAIGELHTNKGYEYLLRAFTEVNHQPATPLVILGDGEEKHALEHMIAEHKLADRVFLLGQIPDASKYLKAFDVFSLTSVKEGLPYVLLEAGLAGLPIVATDVGGISEIIEDRKTGLLVKTRDVATVADSLSLLLGNAHLRQSLGTSLHASVTQNFPVEKMLENTIAVYTK
jgi:glycosyltransferase involved in cell wall biosynthesis